MLLQNWHAHIIVEVLGGHVTPLCCSGAVRSHAEPRLAEPPGRGAAHLPPNLINFQMRLLRWFICIETLFIKWLWTISPSWINLLFFLLLFVKNSRNALVVVVAVIIVVVVGSSSTSIISNFSIGYKHVWYMSVCMFALIFLLYAK